MVVTGGIDRAALAKRLFSEDGPDEVADTIQSYDPHEERKRRRSRSA